MLLLPLLGFFDIGEVGRFLRCAGLLPRKSGVAHHFIFYQTEWAHFLLLTKMLHSQLHDFTSSCSTTDRRSWHKGNLSYTIWHFTALFEPMNDRTDYILRCRLLSSNLLLVRNDSRVIYKMVRQYDLNSHRSKSCTQSHAKSNATKKNIYFQASILVLGIVCIDRPSCKMKWVQCMAVDLRFAHDASQWRINAVIRNGTNVRPFVQNPMEK